MATIIHKVRNAKKAVTGAGVERSVLRRMADGLSASRPGARGVYEIPVLTI